MRASAQVVIRRNREGILISDPFIHSPDIDRLLNRMFYFPSQTENDDNQYYTKLILTSSRSARVDIIIDIEFMTSIENQTTIKCVSSESHPIIKTSDVSLPTDRYKEA